MVSLYNPSAEGGSVSDGVDTAPSELGFGQFFQRM
jgi:hypothetical protein